MDEVLVLTNFKNYRESTLKSAENLLEKFSELEMDSNLKLAFSVCHVDARLAPSYPRLSIYSQHVDENDPGAATGKVTIESLMELGVKGSLLNHSENRLPEGKISATIRKAIGLGFKIILCVENPEEAEKYAPLHPTYIAYEPPELIGGDISVSSARPSIISDVVSICSRENVPVLVGAGVKSRSDLEKSVELGAKGVLIASGIVKSSNPVASLNSLISS